MRKFITILLILVVALGGLAAVWYFSGGFGGATPTILVKCGGQKYFQSADLGEITSGAEFEVYAIGDYEIRIEARAGKEFTFTVGEEKYSWSDLKGKDLTDGFQLDKTDHGFTLIHKGITSILSEFYNSDVVIVGAEEVVPEFNLIISTGNSELEFSFTINNRAEEITVSPDHIYF